METIDSQKNFIISADDFGMSAETNEAIFSLARTGKIQRIAIVAKGNFTKEEIEEISKLGIEIDIHLTLPYTAESAVLPGKAVTKRFSLFLFRFVSGKISPSKMEEEWENQIEIFKEKIGRYPDGINSHEHIHFFPPYFKRIIRLAKKYRISHVRFGSKGLVKSQTPVFRILNLLWEINKSPFENSFLNSSAFLVGLDWIKNIEKFLAKTPQGTMEIVCHPENKREKEIIQRYF